MSFSIEAQKFLLKNEIYHNMLLNIDPSKAEIIEIKSKEKSNIIAILVKRAEALALLSLPDEQADLSLVIPYISNLKQSLITPEPYFSFFQSLSPKITFELGFYQLSVDQLKLPSSQKGLGRLATLQDDLNQLANFYLEFRNEIHFHQNPKQNPEDFKEEVLKDIKEKINAMA
jgi:hypothetical protein